MNKMLTNIVPDEAVFELGTKRTLADVLTECGTNLTGTARRDMRTLIDRIVLSPVEVEGRTHLAIDLHGDIAVILSMASQTGSKTTKPPKKDGFAEESIKLVAGAGFEPAAFRL